MANQKDRLYWRIAGMGAIAGMRSTVALAIVSNYLARKRPEELQGSRFERLATPQAADATLWLTAGELLADKLPGMPDRTAALPLLGRAASGAVGGATLAAAEGEHPVAGALLGGLSAVMGAMNSLPIRKLLIFILPGLLAGMVEDAAVILGGQAILKATLRPGLGHDLGDGNA